MICKLACNLAILVHPSNNALNQVPVNCFDGIFCFLYFPTPDMTHDENYIAFFSFNASNPSGFEGFFWGTF